MSLTLNNDPVILEGGIIKNLFPGFRPVEYVFKREDLAIVSIGSGVGGNIEITIATDLSSYLDTNDFIYLYAIGDSGSFTYDLSAQITAITATTITIDSKFIELSTGVGYINYLKNYYVEMELVGEENADRKVIPFSLKEDGDLEGNITIDVSIANDKNKELFSAVSTELTDGRIKFLARWREVSLGVTGSWVDAANPVILIYAWDDFETEELINNFEYPKLYKGYDSGIIASHSDDNGAASFIAVSYEELDINKATNVALVNLEQLDINFYGLLFFLIPSTLVFDSKTKYIKFTGSYKNLPDYLTGDYADADYLTI